MPGRQAKLISATVLNRMLAYVNRQSRTPARDRVMILLSVRAGLRAAEVAKITWSMVLDANGWVGKIMVITDHVAKKRGGRRIPIHAELRAALIELWRKTLVADGPIVRSLRGGAMKPNSIVNWFVTLFAALSVAGCSSHSGRRTFITQAARNVHRAGCSLRDVQLLAGHCSIETTQRYIDGRTEGQRRLIGLL
jgi:integrase/recombinase XerD